MSIFQRISLIIVLYGAINLGVLGLFGFDSIAFLFGEMTFMTRVIYTLIGFFGVLNISLLSFERNRRIK